ncbi:hypothetical protein BJ508DRAFT_351214 [Ascobolus immersus RN42]|uniref:Uncharacterized protein n=1 Tax=Ascobolus immersus RN42 TaxID=1160509 RepID=A0A3N4HST4_ASCIM|nr:hypothetical protein BJ508DRAFT_351214 [Ascobolus immersus RN42]
MFFRQNYASLSSLTYPSPISSSQHKSHAHGGIPLKLSPHQTASFLIRTRYSTNCKWAYTCREAQRGRSLNLQGLTNPNLLGRGADLPFKIRDVLVRRPNHLPHLTIIILLLEGRHTLEVRTIDSRASNKCTIKTLDLFQLFLSTRRITTSCSGVSIHECRLFSRNAKCLHFEILKSETYAHDHTKVAVTVHDNLPSHSHSLQRGKSHRSVCPVPDLLNVTRGNELALLVDIATGEVAWLWHEDQSNLQHMKPPFVWRDRIRFPYQKTGDRKYWEPQWEFDSGRKEKTYTLPVGDGRLKVGVSIYTHVNNQVFIPPGLMSMICPPGEISRLSVKQNPSSQMVEWLNYSVKGLADSFEVRFEKQTSLLEALGPIPSGDVTVVEVESCRFYLMLNSKGVPKYSTTHGNSAQSFAPRPAGYYDRPEVVLKNTDTGHEYRWTAPVVCIMDIILTTTRNSTHTSSPMATSLKLRPVGIELYPSVVLSYNGPARRMEMRELRIDPVRRLMVVDQLYLSKDAEWSCIRHALHFRNDSPCHSATKLKHQSVATSNDGWEFEEWKIDKLKRAQGISWEEELGLLKGVDCSSSELRARIEDKRDWWQQDYGAAKLDLFDVGVCGGKSMVLLLNRVAFLEN